MFSRRPKPTAERPKQKKFLGHGDKNGVLEFEFPIGDESIQTVKLHPERMGEFEEE
jgi:hypothetical protein